MSLDSQSDSAGQTQTGDRPHEDLLKDGTQYPYRLQMRVRQNLGRHNPGHSDTEVQDCATTREIFFGFRSVGRNHSDGWSLYVGADLVLQFNGENELRRLYVENERFSAAGRRLEKLTRDAQGARVRFVREILPEEVERRTHADCLQQLRWLASELERGSVAIVGQFPESIDLFQEARDRLSFVTDGLRIAVGPNA